MRLSEYAHLSARPLRDRCKGRPRGGAAARSGPDRACARPPGHWLRVAVFGRLLVAGEDQVERALRLRENLARLLKLRLVAGAQHLRGGERHVLQEAADLARLVAD